MNNMNNRLRLLTEQAGITFTDYGSGEFLDKDDIDTDRLEKFAELIVRECIGILEPKSRYMGEGPEVLKDKISQIKKHFGVEE
jgi:hypothetical protein